MVEIIVNGKPSASSEVEADGRVHDLAFDLPIERSSWVALRHFPQLHTNPVNVIVAGQPIRASKASALWCIATIRRLWDERGRFIPPGEQDAAKAAFDEAIAKFQRIAGEAHDDLER